jgi:cytochrome c553
MRSPSFHAAGAALTACLLAPCAAPAAAAAPPAAAVCASCHGAQGQGSAAGVPRLAGQGAAYLQHALESFRSGARSSPVMQPIASSLSAANVQMLAGYFAGLHGVAAPAGAPPDAALVRAGETLAQVGAALDPTPACLICHGSAGRRDNGRFPSLGAQPAAYVVERLHDFQARAQAKAPEPVTMTAVAARLSEAQVRQAAAYFSTLPGP